MLIKSGSPLLFNIICYHLIFDLILILFDFISYHLIPFDIISYQK